MRLSTRTKLMFFTVLCFVALSVSACATSDATPEPQVVITVCATEPAGSVAGEPAPTYTPYPTYTPNPPAESLPTHTPYPTYTPYPTFTPASDPEATPDAEPTDAPEPTAAPTTAPSQPTSDDAAPTAAPVSVPAPQSVSSSAVEILDDPNVAPPLTVLVSANHEYEGYHHLISGELRNDGDQNYAGLGVVTTFFMDDGRRYGPIKVNLQCPLIAPGDVCPFVVEATSKNLVSAFLHPEGFPTDRGSAPVTLTGIGSYRDGIGYVRVTGNAYNPNPFPIKNTTVNSVLRNAAGEIVSVGRAVVLDIIEPGQSAPFDVSVEPASYSTYQLYVQSEPK